MKLYHATDAAGAAGIAAEGFARDHTRQASSYFDDAHGLAVNPARSTSVSHLVVVDVPEVEAFRYRTPHGTYLIPHVEANRLPRSVILLDDFCMGHAWDARDVETTARRRPLG